MSNCEMDLPANHDSEKIFSLLFNKYQEDLYRFSYKITRSPEQAADIVQEVFISLWEHRNEIAGIQNLEGWLHRSARNKLIDFMRKAAADQRLRESLWLRQEKSISETENLLDAKESASRIREAINNLPEKRRLVFQLNRNQGLNYDEIALQLSISRHTVKNQIWMALQSIQRILSVSLTFLFITH